jgi:hypothetical protein
VIGRIALRAARSSGPFALWIATCIVFGCVPDQTDPGPTASNDRSASDRSGLSTVAPVKPASAPAPLGPEIRLTEHNGKTIIEVSGLDANDVKAIAEAQLNPAQSASLFAVYAEFDGSDAAQDRPPILGAYEVDGALLRFVPRFPLQPGLRYRAVLDPAHLPGKSQGTAAATGGSSPIVKPIVAELSIPKPPAVASTTLSHIYPSTQTPPENLLRFYLVFSAPMSRGEMSNCVHLLDADGKEVETPFLNLGEELWNPAGTRLTLLINPGRIKQGLKPREELGPVLEQGKTYTLVVDSAWLDAEGNPLKEGARKVFNAGPAAEQIVDPETWKLASPAAGSTSPLAVSFPAPLDRGMLERVIGVVDANGEPVPGDIDVEADETRWLFTPDQPWSAGSYKVLVDSNLEDLAGNSIGRVFEVDVFEPIQRRVLTETVTIPFEVRAPGASK